jgi:hypothetical protein
MGEQPEYANRGELPRLHGLEAHLSRAHVVSHARARRAAHEGGGGVKLARRRAKEFEQLARELER